MQTFTTLKELKDAEYLRGKMIEFRHHQTLRGLVVDAPPENFMNVGLGYRIVREISNDGVHGVTAITARGIEEGFEVRLLGVGEMAEIKLSYDNYGKPVPISFAIFTLFNESGTSNQWRQNRPILLKGTKVILGGVEYKVTSRSTERGIIQHCWVSAMGEVFNCPKCQTACLLSETVLATCTACQTVYCMTCGQPSIDRGEYNECGCPGTGKETRNEATKE